MTGKTDMRTFAAQPGEHILNFAKPQAMDGKAQPPQHPGQNLLRASIRRGNRRTANKRLSQRKRIGEPRGRVFPVHQSRNSSLIDVFDRVCASTVFTMTAQYSDGPGDPFGRALPGKDPGTTTE